MTSPNRSTNSDLYRDGLAVNKRDGNVHISTIGNPQPEAVNSSQYPRPSLPPPLPPIARTDQQPSTSKQEGSVNTSSVSPERRPSATARRPPQSTNGNANNHSTTSAPSGVPPRPRSAASPPLAQIANQSATSVSNSVAPTNNNNNNNVTTASNTVRRQFVVSPTPASTPNASATKRRNSRSVMTHKSERSSRNEGDEEVEELMPLPLSRTQPVEKFFVQFSEENINREDAAGQPRNEEEMLLEQFAEYTDDDSFFSSGSTVIECDPKRLEKSGLRDQSVNSVHETLQLLEATGGRSAGGGGSHNSSNDGSRTSWMFQIHHRAIALEHSSFFVFPARWTPRVVVYNVMHHWLMELLICFIIFAYAIFDASWARYTAPRGKMKREDFMLWADVYYTVLLGVEVLARLFASGFLFHPRAFFRSPWHWLDTATLVLTIMACTWWQYLWNFTAWRLIRCIKGLTYVPVPLRMKLLAKSLLRSTNRLINVTVVLLYFIFFFGLLGLQIFSGQLHSRCVNEITGFVTDQICREVSTGQYWFYWGYHCNSGFKCVNGPFPNPNYGFRNFDDIGHALLCVFQIMTFQDWTSLMNETSDGTAVLAFLYYACTILLCTYIVPSLYVGVFIEKIERTSRLFVLKQLEVFDNMLMEQRQRMSALVKLHDFVERDEHGRVSHYPAYEGKRLTDDDISSNSQLTRSTSGARNTRKPISQTPWTDEQRVQLHLALTRQRHVAAEAERKRMDMRGTGLADQILAADGTVVHAHQHKTQVSTATTTTTRGATRNIDGTTNFALGGRVGAVQHHKASNTIGASRQSELPFAVRQEVEAENIRFLDPYSTALTANANTNNNNNNSTMLNGSAAAVANNNNNNNMTGMNDYMGGSQSRMSRPPLGPGTSVVATRESAGIVPNRASMSMRESMMRTGSSRQGSVSGVEGSHSLPRAEQSYVPPPVHQQETIALIVNDPEGGDFDYADGCWAKFGIIRNICHMFTEGYPRILTQYLWEHRMLQYRYGLTPMNYTNKYEEAALCKLRQRRLRERQEERAEMRRFGQAVSDDEDDEDVFGEDYDGTVEAQWMREEGLVAGSMSPIRMALNIKENAPTTIFNYIWYFLIIANAVFNASRFDTMPDYWEMGTFVAGVCFSVLFMLELIVRFIALGPGPFLSDLFNLIEATFVIISLFQLGFSRANTISLFNWVRFLRLFRVAPIRPLRRVARVLIHAFPDMVYALIFFSFYMFMWLLIGMGFFGSRIGWIDYATSSYFTRGNFESFSHAAYAIAQAFSVTRDQWLYISWSGMRVRGGYTVMYFIATVLVAFIFRFFFIAVMTYAWQTQEEREDYMFMTRSTTGDSAGGANASTTRLRWFDFTVWRSFKHIHGGFERRDVAPDEVYYLNEDMRRQLRLVEAKDRYYTEIFEQQQQLRLGSGFSDDGGRQGDGPVYVNWGGQLYRQPSASRQSQEQQQRDGDNAGGTLRPQLRFAREYRRIPATTYGEDAEEGENDIQLQNQNHTGGAATGLNSSVNHYSHGRPPSVQLSEQSRSMVNPLIGNRHSLSPAHGGGAGTRSQANITIGGGVGGGSVMTGAASSMQNANNTTGAASMGTQSVTAQLLRLGRSKPAHGNAHNETEMTNMQDIQPSCMPEGVEEEDYEHVLLGGPRFRYKSVIEGGRRVFERCLDCNTHKQMPLRAPPLVAQRTADQLHAEHCHMSAVRSSRQLVLKALVGYTRMQDEHEVVPTKRVVETVLGQAWSCGMLLFETIDNLSCADLPESLRTWDRMLEALEVQQWLLSLHVGEEQVGRATLAYVLAHQEKQDTVARETSYKESWQDHTFFVLSPSNPFRRALIYVVESWWFEAFILFIIFGASVCLACYTPGNNDRDMGGSYNSGKYKALHVLDDIFSVIFTVEMVVKMIAMGVILPVKRAYFWHLWNIFDCFIVIISLVSWGDHNIFLRYLKVMRCFYILSPLRHWEWNKSMTHVAKAVWDSIPTLANVCLIMLMNYIVWAIIFVSMFMNKMNFCSNDSFLNKTLCEDMGYKWYPAQRNFRNFYESLLTTFEVSTGTEWMDVMYGAVDSWSTHRSPIMNRHPYLGLVMIAYYYVSNFILFSLFVSAMIYCYLLAKNAAEGVAGITFEHQLWLRMQGMILQLKPRVRLIAMNNALSRFLHFLTANKWFEAFMGFILTCNMVTMALHWYGMNNTQRVALDVFQYVFIGFFTAEVVFRLVAYGPRFFTRWAYCWDLLIVLLSFIQIGLNTTRTHRVPFDMNVLRVLRMGRFLHLVDLILPFQTYLTLFNHVIRAAIPGIINVTLIYMLAVYVFAILGLHLLGYIVPYGGYINNTYNNFQTFVNALIMVFRLSTLENWVTMLRGSLNRGNYCARGYRCGPTDWAPVYYVPIVIAFFLLISTLYIAVIVDHYVTAIRLRASVTRMHDLRSFTAAWTRRDPNGTLMLPTTMLPSILEELRLPLGISSRYNRIELLQILREYNIPDHDGEVYYYEVLVPLARRVMAMAFHENEETAEQHYDLAWRLSERSLGALPVSAKYPGTSSTTVAEHYAASYVQAAYRRDRAMRNLYIAKSDMWKQGREACSAKGLPFDAYGFGSVGLAYEDPRDGAVRGGFYIPEGATMNATSGPIYGGNVRAAQLQADREAAERAKEGPATMLPAMYRSAIQETEKRFGPDAPDAIRRYERRSDKLERKRAQEDMERQQSQIREGSNQIHPLDDELVESACALRASQQQQPRGGSSRPWSASHTGASTSGALRSSQYNTNVDDVNYQPPLGTDPASMMEGELQRRQASAMASRYGSQRPARSPSK